MAVLFTDSLSIAGYKAFLRTVSNLRWRTKVSMVSEISSLAYCKTDTEMFTFNRYVASLFDLAISLVYKICFTCVLNFNCFIRHPHHCRSFNDIRNCASELKNCDLITKVQQALIFC